MGGGRRHPSRMQLEAWFDGEAPEGLGWHLVGCASCFAHLSKMARIRAAVRQQARVDVLPGVPASGALAAASPVAPAAPAPLRHGVALHQVPRRAVVLAGVPLVLLLMVALLTAGVVPSPLHSALSSSTGHPGGSHALRPAPGTAPGRATSGTGPATAAAGPGPAVAKAAGGGTPSGAGLFGPADVPLRLAVVVPTQGAEATEGLEVVDAVTQAVSQANAAGGVGGAPVALTVVPAEDAAAVAALPGEVDAVVGGFGAAVPASVPWILPADPAVTGTDVVAAELTPVEAGTRLGQDLLRRGVTGTVGVVVGSGPDAGLEQGLAGVVPVSVVDAPSSGACLPALTALPHTVSAIAIAGSASLAGSCVAALATMAWKPPGGILLAPSAAYAGVPGPVAGGSVFSVLGLPWPSWSSPGAAGFRSAVPGDQSYRALVSFAATELAVQVARTTGAPRLDDVAWGTWTSDLYDFAGAQNACAEVVEDWAGGWVKAS